MGREMVRFYCQSFARAPSQIVLDIDLRRAGRTDAIEDTVDYKAIKQNVVAMVEASSCYLVEHLAQRVADVCLEHPRVQRTDVTVDKPGALRFARSVAVEIARERNPSG